MSPVRRIFLAGFAVGFSWIMLAGCQDGVKFKLSDQRIAEQVGLRIDPMGSFGRAGILATQPRNLPRAYLEHGELAFGVYRITNTTEDTIELYPTSEKSPETPAGVLSQYFVGACIRESFGCLVDLGAYAHPSPDLISEYFSEFDLLGSEFRFESGGLESIGPNAGTANARPIRIRAGESAVWTMRLGLRRNSALIPSAPFEFGGAGGGESFQPSGYSWDPVSRLFRIEALFGLKFSISITTTLLVRNAKTDELNPVYYPAVDSPYLFAAPALKEIHTAFPPPKVARRINGLAEQI